MEYPCNRVGKRVVGYCLYLLVLVLSDLCPLCAAQQYSDPFRVSPQDTVAVRGSTVVLRCALQRQMVGAIVLWSRFEPGTMLRNRVTITGQQNAGEFNLRITNVRESDAGRYECRAMLGLMNIVRRSATLTVVVPPDPGYPQCSMQPSSGLVPGRMVILTCRTRGGQPPPVLNWHQGSQQMGKPTTNVNIQRYTLKPTDYGVVFECRESGPASPFERSCILVPLRGYVTVDITPKDPVISEGEEETFGCNAQGALSITYSWYINGIPLVLSPLFEHFALGGNNQLLTIYNAARHMDDTRITCVATANTGQMVNASSVLNVLPRQVFPTLRPGATPVNPSTTWSDSGPTIPPGTDKPPPSRGPNVPGNPESGRPHGPNRPGGPYRPGRGRPGDEEDGDDSREEDGDGDDLINSDREGRERENLAGAVSNTTMTVVGAAMAGLIISLVIVATIRLMSRVRPGTKDTLITISGSNDSSEEIEPNSFSTNRNTFASFRSTTSCEVADPKRITFSDRNREYDLPPFEPDDTLSYLGLRPESMVSTRYTYEGLHSDTSTSVDNAAHSVRYYEISSGEYDNSLEYEDVISEHNSVSDNALRPMSILTDDGLYLRSLLPVPGYNSRTSINNRVRML